MIATIGSAAPGTLSTAAERASLFFLSLTWVLFPHL